MEGTSSHPLRVVPLRLEAHWKSGRLVGLALVSGEVRRTRELSASGPAKRLEDWVEAWSQRRAPPAILELLDWSFVPVRTAAILAVLEGIPAGRTFTYADVASLAGIARGYQAIGQAMRRNPFPLVVPCHRVVASNGTLGGYSAGGPAIKALLLGHEGAAPRLSLPLL